MSKISKMAPAWHADAIAELKKDFIEINALEMSAAKRRAYLGLKFHYVKERGRDDGSIPFGQFEDWVHRNCKEIPDRSRRRYMNEAESLVERMGWQIGQIGRFEIPPHKLIELPTANLPAAEQQSQQLLLELVEDRSERFGAITTYKQIGADGKTRRGQLPGSKGLTKLDRMLANQRKEKANLESCIVQIPGVCMWLKKYSNALGFPQLPKEKREQIRAAIEDAHLYFKSLERDGGAQ